MRIIECQLFVIFAITLLLFNGNFASAESAIQMRTMGPYFKFGENIVGNGFVIFENGYAVGTNSPQGLPVSIELYDPIGNVVYATSVPLTNDLFTFSIPTGSNTKVKGGGEFTIIAYYGKPSKTLLNTPYSTSAEIVITDAPYIIGQAPQIKEKAEQTESQENTAAISFPDVSDPNNWQYILGPIFLIGIILMIYVKIKYKPTYGRSSRRPTTYQDPIQGRIYEREEDEPENPWKGMYEETIEDLDKDVGNVDKAFRDSLQDSADFANDFFGVGKRRKKRKR